MKFLVLLVLISLQQPVATEKNNIEDLRQAIIFENVEEVDQILGSIQLTEDEKKDVDSFLFNLSYGLGNVKMAKVYDNYFPTVSHSKLFKILYYKSCLNGKRLQEPTLEFLNWIWKKRVINIQSSEAALNDFYNACLEETILRSNDDALKWLNILKDENKRLRVDESNSELIKNRLGKISKMKRLLGQHQGR